MVPASLVLAVALAAPVPATAKSGAFDWPQFRGPDRDGASKETGLLKEWPEGGPKKLWTVNGCGEGYGSVAVAGGFIYGGGRVGDREHVWCRKEADGAEVWSTPYSAGYNEGHGNGTRGTPTVAGDKVYLLAPRGDLVCVSAKDGKEVWKKSYTKDFGGAVPGWGYSESVLVDGDRVIGTPCANKAALVALNKDTGEVIWKTEVKDVGRAGGYASATKMTVGKTDLYVTLLGDRGGVVGVDAKTGKPLWQYTRVMNPTANIPTPVVKGDLVWCSTGYGQGGSALLHVKESGGTFEAEELKYYKGNEVQNHHGGMALVGDYVYFGRGHNNGLPTCVELKTGEVKWKENKGAGGGEKSGSVVAADGMLYFRYENGVVALVTATPDRFELKGSFTIPNPQNKYSWQHPVVANGRLYLREQGNLHCYDVKKGG